MSADGEPLIDLAESVADGRDLDWQAVSERASTEEERRLILELATVARIARAHATADTASELAKSPMASKRAEPAKSSGLERWGHLEIREKVGQGGFGEVYRAWDPTLERDVALKLLRSHRRAGNAEAADASIVQEGRNMARVRHGNSVVVHGAASHDDRVGVWMEFVRGQSLEAILRQQGPFGAREAASIGVDVLRALAAVHAAGIVHRDVKAQNVMREEGGRIVLMDFGAGSPVDSRGVGSGSDNAGTPLYMAPELLAGGEATPRSDLYGAGVLLHHLVTRGYPYTGSSFTELIQAHERPATRSLRDERPDLPRDFVAVVEKALATNPANRYSSAGEMERALTATIRPQRPLWTIVAAGAVGAAAIVAAVLAYRAATSREFTVSASLCRVTGEHRTPLASGDAIGLNDQLEIELSASRPVWVYVVNEDEKGAVSKLFPMEGYELRNPIPPRDTPWQLPGKRDGKPDYWVVDSAGGRERFQITVSLERLPDLEKRLESVRSAGDDDLDAGTVRGVGRVRPGQETTRAEPRGLIDAVEALTSKPETANGIWKRLVELRNP